MRRLLLFLIVCCSAAPRSSDHKPSAASAPRTFDPGRVYFGPAIINAGPTIDLCPDGRYTKTRVIQTSDVAAGRSVRDGMACCTVGERGTYTLRHDAHGEPVAVRFAPETGAAYESALTESGLEGFYRGPRPPECR